HEDLRRARAAALSMIPTSTGAAKAIGLVIPDLAGKLDGMAVRVPTPNVSLVDLTAELAKPTTEAELNAAVKTAAEGPLQGVLTDCDEPLVLSDFNRPSFFVIFHSQVHPGVHQAFLKRPSSDRQRGGFSNRMRDVALYIGAKLG